MQFLYRQRFNHTVHRTGVRKFHQADCGSDLPVGDRPAFVGLVWIHPDWRSSVAESRSSLDPERLQSEGRRGRRGFASSQLSLPVPACSQSTRSAESHPARLVPSTSKCRRSRSMRSESWRGWASAWLCLQIAHASLPRGIDVDLDMRKVPLPHEDGSDPDPSRNECRAIL